MNNEGAILANEFSASRVKVLHANINRCGISNVALTHLMAACLVRQCQKCSMPFCWTLPALAEGVVRKIPMR